MTREWADGELPDDEFDTRSRQYADHLNRLKPALRDGCEALADLNLHDGQPAVASLAGETFRLRLLIGDLRRGYQWLDLDYQDAELRGVVPEDLPTLADREVLYDEIDLSPDGRYEHRLLLWPHGELGVLFHAVDVTRSGADPSARRV